MTTSYAAERQIAQTILAQITTNTIMCLGVPRQSIRVLPETIVQDEKNGHLGGVSFRFTNCPKVNSGTVEVTLRVSDTYHVVIKNRNGTVKLDQFDVYAEDLGGPDGVIEQVTG